MNIYAHQGDLVIDLLETIPDGNWEEVEDFVFAGDSSGHRHRLLGRASVQRVGRVTRVKVAKDTKLIHEKAGGHNEVSMFEGKAYEIRPQRERGDGYDRAVAD